MVESCFLENLQKQADLHSSYHDFYHVKGFSEILFYLKLISMKFSKFRLNWMVKEYPNVTASLKHNQICFADVEMFDVNKKKDRF